MQILAFDLKFVSEAGECGPEEEEEAIWLVNVGRRRERIFRLSTSSSSRVQPAWAALPAGANPLSPTR
ncbi:MAG: hypothetical protein A3G20_01390 [Acidobacteria bacterium RIFCSPLOWO2_12_FULL_59_11]|nr:MAG: hypothetical protein A3G20_01390 [Acidobacteria bacterium RIFCSPLOWO2_12_FULL_59_11]